jgi:hypothetical protein
MSSATMKEFDIFYDPNKVSKEIFLSDEVYIRILHIAELEV